MPPMKQTRLELIRGLAAFAIVTLAAPFERLAAAGRRVFDPAPRIRKPVNSVRRDG